MHHGVPFPLSGFVTFSVVSLALLFSLLMLFHPTGRGHEDDEDGQEGWSTTATASLIG